MTALAVKREYGPTLASLLAPRWRGRSRRARLAACLAAITVLALALALALTLLNAEYSRGGRVPFSFKYRDLYRVAPEPGGYVRVERHDAQGTLEYSFAVDPLQLPPYSGGLSGELPIYASGFIAELAGRYHHFALRGEGKSKLNSTLTGYQIVYTAQVEGREMYGRDVLLLPEQAGARDGVEIAMLTAPGASSQILSPLEVATTGVLLRPLKSFAFG